MRLDDFSLCQPQAPTPAPPPSALLAETGPGSEAKALAPSGGVLDAPRVEEGTRLATARLGAVHVGPTPAGHAALAGWGLEGLPCGTVAVLLTAAAFLAMLRPPELVLLPLVAWLLLLCLALFR